jgi:protein O-GlcNAc transferase
MTSAPDTDLAAGLRLLSKGDTQGAAKAFENVLRTNPAQPDALHYLGVIAFQSGQPDKAIALIEAALKAQPKNADAESNLGTVLMATGQLDKAEQALRRATFLKPGAAVFHFNLGNIIFSQARLADAEVAYRTAIQHQPDYPEALNNLGTVYRDLENLDAATTCYENAVKQRPTYAEAVYNLANAYRDAGRLSDAATLIRQALALNPSNPKAHNTLGNILSESARSDEALASFQAAMTLDPNSMGIASNVLSCLQYVDGIDAAKFRTAHADWAQRFSQFAPSPPPARARKTVDAPLKVGFISPDFGRHPCGFLSVRLFEHFDRAQINPIVWSTRRATREDDMSRRIAAVADWRRVEALTDNDLAAAITVADVDILIDMSGHTAGHRLGVFARKPAPLQMSWLGYVGTTGLQTMDYIIADRWHAPSGHDSSGPEQFLRLDDGYVVFDPPDTGDVAPLPALRNGYVTFGTLNSPTKLNAKVFDSYAAILGRVQNSKLILRFRGLDDPGVSTFIRAQFKARGIDPTRFDIRGGATPAAFLATYNEIDIALDTFPYSGGLTTCEALWMGVPTVTFPGQTFAGRHATSHMSNAGLADFVARDRSDFENLAVAKANDLQNLAPLRAELRERVAASPLCNGSRFAASFTNAMRAAWQTNSAAN